MIHPMNPSCLRPTSHTHFHLQQFRGANQLDGHVLFMDLREEVGELPQTKTTELGIQQFYYSRCGVAGLSHNMSKTKCGCLLPMPSDLWVSV